MRVLLTAVRNRSGRMLSAGNASASSEAKATSSGIFSWDCAYSSHQKALLLFPLESPPFSHPDWKGYLRKNYLSFHLAKELYYWRNLYQQPVYMPLHRGCQRWLQRDRKSTRLNSSHVAISYAVFCLKKKNK